MLAENQENKKRSALLRLFSVDDDSNIHFQISRLLVVASLLL